MGCMHREYKWFLGLCLASIVVAFIGIFTFYINLKIVKETIPGAPNLLSYYSLLAQLGIIIFTVGITLFLFSLKRIYDLESKKLPALESSMSSQESKNSFKLSLKAGLQILILISIIEAIIEGTKAFIGGAFTPFLALITTIILLCIVLKKIN